MENVELELKYQKIKSQRGRVIQDQELMLKTCERESRELTADESKRYDQLEVQCAELNLEFNEFRKNHPEIAKKYDSPCKPIANETFENRGKDMELKNNDEYRFNANKKNSERTLRDSYNLYLRDGANAISDTEYRALQMDLDSAGGYLCVPQEVSREVLKNLDNEVFVRKLARKFTVEKAFSLGVPTLKTDLGDPEWTGELSTGSNDDDMDFSGRALYPHPLARRIKVSNKLLRAAVTNPEDLVNERMTYKLGIVQENAFLNGTGVDSPLGVFTVSADGIPASRDVSTGNLATAITADGLKNAVGALKAQYRKNAVWIMSRQCENMVSKLKTGSGDYIWRQGIESGRPNSLEGFPIYLSEYCPSTFSSGQYVAILGDFRFYYIVDSLQVQIQRLVELYAESNQTGFICRVECDGAPCLSEAFVRVKLG